MAGHDTDPDFAPGGGRAAALHLRFGRMLVQAAAMVRPRITLGVRLVGLDGAGRVFLVRHSYLPGWHLPGGGVGPGETCREAAIREAREEGGLVLRDAPSVFGIYLNRQLANRDHVILFVARDVAREARPPRSLEVREAAFYHPHDLPAGTTPATRRRIEEVLEARAPEEVW